MMKLGEAGNPKFKIQIGRLLGFPNSKHSGCADPRMPHKMADVILSMNHQARCQDIVFAMRIQLIWQPGCQMS